MRSSSHATGFSLVEICLAIGVVAFAFVGVVGLLPAGMDVYRTSMNESISTQIAQRVLNDAQQSDFASLIGGTPPQTKYYELPPVRYFDEEGNELLGTQSKDSIYHVHTVVQSTPKFPDGSGQNTIPMNELATVVVQVVVNPGQRTFTKDTLTLLWNGFSGAASTPAGTIRNYNVLVAHHD